MKFKFLLAAALAAGSASAASAAVTVIGNSYARTCYESARVEGVSDQQAIETCDMALREEGLSFHDNVATHVNRGILRFRGGDTAGALGDFNAALALDPGQPEAYLNKGVALFRQTSDARAVLPLFTLALEKNTRRPALAYFGRAVAHEELGNLRAAYADYRRASEAEPKWADPKAELARFTVRR